MKYRILLSLLAVLPGAPLPAAAELHSVEVIAFARLGQDSGGELLGEHLRPPDLSGAVRPEDALAASRAALRSPPQQETYAVVGSGGAPAAAQRRLQPQARLMEASGAYRVLYHDAWVQEIDSRSNSIGVRIRDVRLEPGEGGAEPAALRAGELDGVVRVYRSRYYQVDVAAEYRPLGAFARPQEPYAAAPGYPAASAVYVLDDHRRIKTGETHYFDHPRFGLLLRVERLSGDAARP